MCVQLRTGDPLDPKTEVGTLIDEGAAKRVEQWVSETVSQGARPTARPWRHQGERHRQGGTALCDPRHDRRKVGGFQSMNKASVKKIVSQKASKEKGGIQSLERAFAILEQVARKLPLRPLTGPRRLVHVRALRLVAPHQALLGHHL